MIVAVITSFLLGAAVVLIAELYIFRNFFRALPVQPPISRRPLVKPDLPVADYVPLSPEEERDENAKDASTTTAAAAAASTTSAASRSKMDESSNTIGADTASPSGPYRRGTETCAWLNLCLAAIFRFLRDSPPVREWFLGKLNVEFDELLQSSVGRIVHSINITDYSLGTSLPFVTQARIIESTDSMVDIALDVVYDGQIGVTLDLGLKFGLRGAMQVSIVAFSGKLRLRIADDPVPYWSIAFMEDPRIQFDIVTLLSNKNFSNLATLMENQLRRTIKKKHTVPNYKKRPFVKSMWNRMHNGIEDDRIYVNGILLTMLGTLRINLLQIMNLPRFHQECSIYAELALDDAAEHIESEASVGRYEVKTTPIVVSTRSAVFNFLVEYDLTAKYKNFQIQVYERVNKNENKRLSSLSIPLLDICHEAVSYDGSKYRQAFKMHGPESQYSRINVGEVVLEFEYDMSRPRRTTTAADLEDDVDWELPDAPDQNEYAASLDADRVKASPSFSNLSIPKSHNSKLDALRNESVTPVKEKETSSPTTTTRPEQPAPSSAARAPEQSASPVLKVDTSIFTAPSPNTKRKNVIMDVSDEESSDEEDDDVPEPQALVPSANIPHEESPAVPTKDWHRFAGGRFKPTDVCSYCGNKLWSFKSLKCEMCGILCHNKCLHKCLREQPCRKAVANNSAVNKSALSPQHAPAPAQLVTLTREAKPREDESFDDLFPELPKDVRKQTLMDKVSELQQELDQSAEAHAELKNLYRDKAEDAHQRRKLQEQIDQFADEMEVKTEQLLRYCAALQRL